MSNQVILVDKNDNEVGLEEKITAHKKKLLHRAFSIFLFNKSSEILLQKRAPNKYHSGNLWTNTCCSHPLPNISLLESAKKRLFEEMGIEAELKCAFLQTVIFIILKVFKMIINHNSQPYCKFIRI